jgi:hypothetical protein
MKELFRRAILISLISLSALSLFSRYAWSIDPQWSYAGAIALLDDAIDRCGTIIILDGPKLQAVQKNWEYSLAGSEGVRLREIYSINKADHEKRIKEHPEFSLETMCVTSAIMIKIALSKDSPIIAVKRSSGLEELK